MKNYNLDFSEDVKVIMERAACRAKELIGVKIVTSEMLLLEVIESNKDLKNFLVKSCYIDEDEDLHYDVEILCSAEYEIIRTLVSTKSKKVGQQKLLITQEASAILEHAKNLAGLLKYEKVDINCVICSLVKKFNSVWERLFDADIYVSFDSQKLVIKMPEKMMNIYSFNALENGVFGKYTEKDIEELIPYDASMENQEINVVPAELTKMEFNSDGEENLILGRDNQIEAAFDTMQKMMSRNIILVGREGTGKTAIVEGIVERIAKKQCPKALEDAEIYQLNIDELMKDTKFLGQAEEKFDKVKKFLESNPNVILFIDEIHNIIGMGRSSENSYDFANALKPILTKGNVRVIGATTTYEYERYLSRDPAFCRRFEKINVTEPTTEEVSKMLGSQVNKFEKYHGIQVSSEMLEEVIAQATAFDYYTANPSRTMSLLDIAMVKAKNLGKDKLDIISILSVHKSEIKGFNNMDKDEIKDIAIHEAGHFVVTKALQSKNRIVSVVSIIPAREYLGVNCLEYKDNATYLQDRNSILNEIAVCLAGDIATKIKGFPTASGKSSDIEMATRYARKMILEYGLINSETFAEYNSFTVNGQVQTEYLSEGQKELLNKEVNNILKEAEKIAKNVLEQNIKKLDIISNALMQQGILRKEQLDKLYSGELKPEDLPEPVINLIL